MTNDQIMLILTIICAIADACLIILAILYERKQRMALAVKRKFLSSYTFKLVLSAIFVGIAIVLKRFSVSIPLFGADNGMRVGLTGVFSAFPAILCGPLFGGLASAILDVVGYFINPTGPYNIIFTLTAFMAGAVRGFIWIFVKRANKKVLAAITAVLILSIGILGTVNVINLNNDGLMKGMTASTEEMPEKKDLFEMDEIIKDDGSVTYKVTGVKDGFNGKKLSFSSKLLRDMCSSKGVKSFRKNLATYANLITIVLIVASLVGLLFLVLSFVLAKFVFKGRNDFLNIFVSIITAEAVETTINTEAIIVLYGITLPFILYWIPRITESVLVCVIQGYLIALLYGIYLKLPKSFRERIEY